jgi:ABC-type proline/glycine betaine transport system ATPase subunit
VLSELGLYEKRDSTVCELSGGEVKRAGLAQVLLSGADLIVADELGSNLDPGLSDIVHDRFCQHVSTHESGALIALHDVRAALAISHEIFILAPTTLASRPVRIVPTESTWCFEFVHAILCLIQWGREPDLTTVIQEMLRHIFCCFRVREWEAECSVSDCLEIQIDLKRDDEVSVTESHDKTDSQENGGFSGEPKDAYIRVKRNEGPQGSRICASLGGHHHKLRKIVAVGRHAGAGMK